VRIASRKDALHTAVGHVFQQCGWSGLDLSRLGEGKPDWLFVRRSFAVLVEVKTPGWKSRIRPGTAQKQDSFRQTWNACPVLVIDSVAQAWAEAEVLREFK